MRSMTTTEEPYLCGGIDYFFTEDGLRLLEEHLIQKQSNKKAFVPFKKLPAFTRAVTKHLVSCNDGRRVEQIGDLIIYSHRKGITFGKLGGGLNGEGNRYLGIMFSHELPDLLKDIGRNLIERQKVVQQGKS
jgi:hypothetical protein